MSAFHGRAWGLEEDVAAYVQGSEAAGKNKLTADEVNDIRGMLQVCGHASDGDCLPGEILLETIDFERPGGREWLPSGTPFQNFYTFLEGFSDARVYRLHIQTLSGAAFFATKKMSTKDPLEYAG